MTSNLNDSFKNNQVIMTKVKDLFDYRMIPKMLDSSQLSNNEFLSNLYYLQFVIFELDQYLEQNWKLEERVLKSKWDKVESFLLAFEPSKPVDKLLSQLRIYEFHEMNLRNGFKPEDIDIRYFYYYKSCDIKLMRNLIIDKANKNEIQLKFKAFDWLIFDWITEVNDDIADIEEDELTNNCNRFLYAIKKSKSDAIEEYSTFLRYLEKKAVDLFRLSSSKSKVEIFEYTQIELAKTMKLLKTI